MDYKINDLRDKSTSYLKKHCIRKCRALNQPSSWVQTCLNEQRIQFLVNGTLPDGTSTTEHKATTYVKPINSVHKAPSDSLEDMLVGHIKSSMGSEVKDTINKAIETTKESLSLEMVGLSDGLIQKVDERISTLRKPIVINVKDKPVLETNEKITHEKLNDVFECLHYKQKVLLVGPAGTGKSTLVRDAWKGIAKNHEFDPSTSMQYIACSGGLSEAQLLGKMDANGDYHEGLVVDKFENGGLNLFDESDGFDPNVALVTHAMTDNQGFIALPNRTDDPMAFKHDHYYHAEVANTWGDGMDFSYSGRMQQDGAKLDRFGDVKIWVDYDKNLERQLVGVYVDWASMLWDLRAELKKASLDRRFVSTRRFYDAHVWAEAGKSKPWFLERICTDFTDEEKGKLNWDRMLRSYA